MLDSSILDVAVGLCFLYLLLSLACSAAREILEGWVRHRAADLKDAIDQLLDNRVTDLSGQVYGHGLVKALYTGRARPSYIPAPTFALALMDTICPGTAAAPGGAADALWPATSAPPANAALRAGAAAITSAPVSAAVLALIDSAGPDVTAVRRNIEAWFNAAMDRVTGRYKRRTQNIILVLALATVGCLNLDSISLAQALSNDAALRNSLVAAAQEYAKTTPVHSAQPQRQATDRNIDDLLTRIGLLGLPLGWTTPPPISNRWWWIEKTFGLLLTALAISLGAPFWFDTLNRFINFRTATKPKTQ